MDSVGATNVAANVRGSAQAVNTVAHGASAAAQTGFEDVFREKAGSRVEEHAEHLSAADRSDLSDHLKNKNGLSGRTAATRSSKHPAQQAAASADGSAPAAQATNAGLDAAGPAAMAGVQAAQLLALLSTAEGQGTGSQGAVKIGNAGKALSVADGKVLKPEAAQGAALNQVESSAAQPAPVSSLAALSTQTAVPATLAAASLRAVDAGAENLVAAISAPTSLAPVAAHAHASKGPGTQVSADASERLERPEEARVFEASTNALEVGVASGTHGWLRVRAELDTDGAVVAQVVAGSAGAAAALHKELPAISAYLAHEQVGVSSLVVNAADRGAGTQDPASGEAFGFGAGQGSARGDSGGGAEDNGSGAGDRARNTAWNEMPGSRVDGIDGLLNLGSLAWTNGLFGAGTHGGWLNVRV